MRESLRTSVLVGGIASICFFASLGSIRLWDEDEPKNAVVGREMFLRGDWIVPTYNEKLSLDKPVLLYWGMIAAYHVLGVTELAARLPSALAGIGTIVLIFHLGRLLVDSRTGLLASCLTASALMFSILARGATPDSLLIFFITLSLWSFVSGVASRRGGHFCGRFALSYPNDIHDIGLPLASSLGIYTGIGFAVLAKGPIGIVMPVGILGSFLLFFDVKADAQADRTVLGRVKCLLAPRRYLRVLQTLRFGWGLLLVATIALPWYILVALRTHGEWVLGFLGTHNVGRFLAPMEHHHGLPIYYLVAIMAGFFPGSVFLPVSVWEMAGKLQNEGVERQSAGFLFCWIACFVGFFSLAATKLPNYVVPCYPALAIMCGSWLKSTIDKSKTRNRLLAVGYVSFALAGIAISIALTITARTLLHLSSELALPGLVATAGGVVCLAMTYWKRTAASVSFYVLVCIAFTLSASVYTAARANDAQDGPRLAERIHSDLAIAIQRELRVATCDYLPPSLVFYLGHSVERLGDASEISKFFATGGSAVVMFGASYEKSKAVLETDTVLLTEEERFLKHQKVVLLGRANHIARNINSIGTE
jgi:4-amino-4-deoxy-L-arabinose transferase-like glycosyltransferase